MSAVVVDTSVWVSYLGGREIPSLDDALRDGRVYLPPIVVAELFSGRMNERRRGELLDLLSDLSLCESGFDHWVRVGRLRSRLRAGGISVSTPDAHVAQCCVDHGAVLMSEDRVFMRIGEMIGIKMLT